MSVAAFVLICFLFAPRLASADCYPNPAGLVGWWPGDGSANNVLGTNNGTLQGGAIASGTGVVLSAFSFDGTNNYVQVADSAALRPTNLTIEAWVRFAGLDTSGTAEAGHQYIVFKQNTASTDFEGYDLSKTRNGGGDVFEFRVSTASGQSAAVASTTLISTGVWYHVAAVRGSNFLQMYVNGQLQRQTNVSFAQNYGTLPLYFGASGQASWDRRFRGSLDEVSLYNRALSSNEVATIYAAGASGKCKAVNITVQPQSQAVGIGGNAAFTAAATGFGNLSYRWQFNGAFLASATNSSLSITNAQSSNEGSYTTVVSNSLGAVTSAVAVLTVVAPPFITNAPQSQTVVVGANVNFTVGAGGTAPLSYQWLKSGLPLSGQTNAALALLSVSTSHAGSYAVVVSNVAGSITSTPPATLTVNVPPFMTNAPQSQTVIVGASVNFSVGAGGTTPLNYQWRKDGSNLSGRTNVLLALSSVSTNDAGSYDVVIANVAGTVTSTPPATLTVNVTPFISSPPQSQTVVLGTTANFGVGAGGTTPLSYQWRKDGAALAGQNSPTLTLLSVSTNDAGGYDVIVSNVAGSITSTPPAALTVNVPPFVTGPPQNQSATVGSNATFNVVAQGTAPLAYQWRKDGAALAGQNSPTLTLLSVSTNDAGGYDVIVSNVAGSITSTPPAALTVNVPPFVTGPPQNQSATVGSNATFNVVAQGTAPLAYQWRKDGAILIGRTNPSLIVLTVSTNDSGNYDVVVSNVAGAITSAPPVTLTVNVPPFIMNPPQNQTVTAGANVNFSVEANGTSPLSYQWRKNGSNLGGQTGFSLALLSVSANDAGSYDIVVSNVAGSVTSTPPATLVVNPAIVPPFITNAPVSRSVAVGVNTSLSVGAGGTTPLSYQWRKNNALLSGETGASLVLLAVTTNNAGSYDVIVTNSAGTVTSTPPAILTVTPTVTLPPFVTLSPQSQVVGFGATATFAVTAGGTAPLAYQWRKNGSALNGANSATLMLSAVTTNNSGNYDVVITNPGGSVTSAVAALTVKLIVDPELEKAIACALNSAPGQVAIADFSALTNLFARGRGITNLAGLEFATNLAILDLSQNQINDLSPLTKLFRLNSLELEDNQGDVATLSPLIGLTNLTCLMLEQMYVSSYSALSNLTKLTSLKVSGGGVVSLDFVTRLTKLTALNVSQNGIRSLSPLAGLTNLTQLDLRWNPAITNYSILTGNLTNLVSLCLGGNSITNLPSLQNLRQLTHLNLADNKFSSVPSLSGPTNLTYLVLSRNPVQGYSSLATLSNLAYLELSGGAISDLTFLSNLRRLAYLDLSYDAVTNLSPLVGLTNLSGLVLAGNPVQNYVPLAGLANFSNLWLHKSSIADAAVVSGLWRLRHLNLDDNSISNASPLLGLTNLTGLGISRNPLGNPLAVTAFTNLSSLRLEGDSISDISALGALRQLAYLSLSQNRITNGAPLASLTNLQNHYLGENRLHDLLFLEQLPDLREVDLSLNLLAPTNGSSEMSVVDDLHCQDTAMPGCACALPATVTSGRGVSVTYYTQHEPPTVLAPSNWYVALNAIASLRFAATYRLSPSDPLTVSGTSSAANVVPSGNLSFSGTGDTRVVTIGAGGNQVGTTTLSLFATNAGGLTGKTDMAVTVLSPINVTNMLSPGVPLNPSLEHALRSASGNYVSDLTSVDLLNITRLDANGVDFTGFSGWQWLSNVTSLQLSGSSISSLSFLANLPQLINLSIAGTSATNFAPLASLPNLTTLYLAGPAVSNLTFAAGCTRLSSLGLNRTRVADLTPLAGLTNLTSVRLQYNTVANIISLNNLPFLSYVDLRFNVLDTTDGSSSSTTVANLLARNVRVDYLPQRTAPLIQVANSWFVSGDKTSILSFEVSDNSETVFGQLAVGGSSSNPGLLPNSNMQVRPDTNSNIAEWMLAVTPTPGQSGVTVVTLGATNDVGQTSSTSLVVTVSTPLALNGAFFGTTDVTWRNGAGGNWFGQSAVSYQDSPAAQSASVVHGGLSTLEAELIGPGTLSFWWKVSSETNYDWLVFESAQLTNEISGQVDWQQKAVPIAPRTQVVRWRYTKDLNMVTGQDAAWIANVTFVPDTWLDLTGPPTNAKSYLTLYGLTGQEYEMQISTNALDWSPLSTVLSTNRITPYIDMTATNQVRFYRARGSGF